MSKTIGECGGHQSEMTLRDWFAGMAANGYLACWSDSAVKPASVAKTAYAVADAMLKERGELDTNN